jgi:HAD superfamily hydrolase (TIGR01509 family)
MERKNIIFDLIGVLYALDTYAIFRNMGAGSVLRYMIMHQKNPFTIAFAVLNAMHRREQLDYRVIKYKNNTMPRCITEWQSGIKTNKQALVEIEQYIHTPEAAHLFKNDYEREIVKKIIMAIFNSSSLTAYMRPIVPNVLLVKDLKEHTDHKLYLLSNFDAHAINTLALTYPEFFSLFDGVIVSGQVGLLKPYPEMYNYLLQTYDLRPEDSLFIDDQYENVQGAEHVGIPCVLYKNPSQLRKKIEQCNLL